MAEMSIVREEVSMTVGLEWLLAQRELGLRLVAGAAAQAQLTWAHAVDIADPTPWLSGGEFVLTTGIQLPRSGREQRAYVDRLADVHVAALGFGVGVRFDEIPDAIVAASTAQALPLVEVPLLTPFIAVTQAIARKLSEQEMAALQQALTDQRRITRSAVRAGLAGLTAELGRELRCEVAVLDEYGAVMAATARGGLLELIIDRWQELVPDGRRGVVSVATEQGNLEIQTLRGRTALVGWLVVRRGVPLSPTDRMVLNQAAGLITVQLDWPAELIATYHALGATLLDLLLGANYDATTLVRHLGQFGFDADGRVMLAVATGSRARARVVDVVSETLERAARPHVVSTVEEGVAVLLLARDAPQLVEVLGEALNDTRVGKPVIGVSGTLRQGEAASGLAPALLAAAAARREGQRIGWFDDLTLSAVIADDLVRSRIRTLAGPVLDALARDATSREADLLSSLQAFLENNGSWESAARELGVHRHTLRSRMSRVEELTGLALDVAENRVLLLLALMSQVRDPD